MKQKTVNQINFGLVAWGIILAGILAIAYREVWQRGAQIKRLEAQVETLRADKAELAGDLAEMQQTPLAYLLLYRRATLARFERIEPRWDEILETTWTMAKKHGVPADVIIGQLELESNFDPAAVGAKGEVGLLQIYAPAWPQFDLARGMEIKYNLDFGCMIFARCMKDAKGDIREALRFYNGQGKLPEGLAPYADRVLGGRAMRSK